MTFVEIIEEEYDCGDLGFLSVRYTGNCYWNGSSYDCDLSSINFVLTSIEGKELNLTKDFKHIKNKYWLMSLGRNLEEKAEEQRNEPECYMSAHKRQVEYDKCD